MDSQVSVDLDMLEQLPAKTMLTLVSKRQEAKKFMDGAARTIQQFAAFFRFLEEQDIDVRFDFGSQSIDFSFTGDGQRLGRIWGELRRSGYKTDHKPKKGDTSVLCWWRQDGWTQIFMNFSSSLCRRVQVGTETKEVPIYQTVCGDLPGVEQLDGAPPALSAPESAPAPALVDDDIPF